MTEHSSDYEWNFRIEGGDPGQVLVERDAAEKPSVVSDKCCDGDWVAFFRPRPGGKMWCAGRVESASGNSLKVVTLGASAKGLIPLTFDVKASDVVRLHLPRPFPCYDGGVGAMTMDEVRALTGLAEPENEPVPFEQIYFNGCGQPIIADEVRRLTGIPKPTEEDKPGYYVEYGPAGARKREGPFDGKAAFARWRWAVQASGYENPSIVRMGGKVNQYVQLKPEQKQ